MEAPPTHTVFINYRRQDAAFPAGWLYEQLVARFGQSQVFKDVDSIGIGEDFVDVITTAVRACRTVLVVIGPGWLTASDEEGRRRLEHPDDFVRIEIETALSSKIPLIPVLVMSATMPRSEELPSTLAPLARRNAVEISSNHFTSDFARLADGIERIWREADEREEDVRRRAERDEAARRRAERDEAARRRAERDQTARGPVRSDAERPTTTQSADKRTIGRRPIAWAVGAVVVAAVATSTAYLASGGGLSFADLQRMSASPGSCSSAGEPEIALSNGSVATSTFTATCSDAKFTAWEAYEDAAAFAITEIGATSGSCATPPPAGSAQFEKVSSSTGFTYGLACRRLQDGATAGYQLRWVRQGGLYVGLADFSTPTDYSTYYDSLKKRIA